MSGILNSGKLATLLGRLTSTRASNLDNLDASVDGCTKSSVWTNTKAGYLDQAISSISASLPVATALSAATAKAAIGITSESEAANVGMAYSLVNKPTTSTGVYSTLLSDSGEGVLQYLSLGADQTNTDLMQARLVIDGTTVWTSASVALDDGDGWSVAGFAYDGTGALSVALDQIRYTTSFSLDVRNNTDTSPRNFHVASRYYTTD